MAPWTLSDVGIVGEKYYKMTNREIFSWAQYNVHHRVVHTDGPLVPYWLYIKNSVISGVDRVCLTLKQRVRGANRFDKP